MTDVAVGRGPGGDSPDSDALPEFTTLGGYRLVQQLGEGGMGVVHLALDRSGRAVAIKVLRPHVAVDPAARTRLAREVETLSRIRHPNVAGIIDHDVEGPRPFIVTRYVAGPSLDQVIAAQGRLSGPALLQLGRGLAQALHAIHGAGVVHRDVKPGNVLLLDGEPVLIDFGIAHIADDERITRTGLVMGTPGYLSPEIIEGAEVTESTDWWGWAVTLGFAAAGRAPFGRGSMETVLARVVRGDADLTGVDPGLVPLLDAALSPYPEDRPTDGEILAALETYAEGGQVTDVLRAVPRRDEATGALAADPAQARRDDPGATRPIEPAPTAVLPPAMRLMFHQDTHQHAHCGRATNDLERKTIQYFIGNLRERLTFRRPQGCANAARSRDFGRPPRFVLRARQRSATARRVRVCIQNSIFAVIMLVHLLFTSMTLLSIVIRW